MSIGKRLLEEHMDLTCSECGEEFPEYLRNMFRAQGLREAARLATQSSDYPVLEVEKAIRARIKELEGPHGEFLTK